MKPKFILIINKLYILLFLLIGLNCSKDNADNPAGPPPPPPPPPAPATTSPLLYYGGDSFGAPDLDSGSYEAAARYTPTKIGKLVGETIKEIHYYITSVPGNIKVKLYGPNNATTPGNLLYSAEVTRFTEPNKWNVHVLTDSIKLNAEDIWLSIELKHAVRQQSIGCDPGPNIKDGDWLYNSVDNTWLPFTQRSGASINWNIRLKVAL